MRNSSAYNSDVKKHYNVDSPYYKFDRIGNLPKNVAKEFNTYRNWREFPLALPAVWDDEGNLAPSSEQPDGLGLKSLFNNVAAVYADYGIRKEQNMPLLDSPSIREHIRQNTDCTVKNLVKLSKEGRLGRAVYSYADFMYCRYLGKIPNNYLITLRKFPLPCSDHINCLCDEEISLNKHFPDIGRMVTWMGTPGNEMSNILSYSYKIPWQKNSAPMDEQLNDENSSGGALGQMISTLDKSYLKEVRATNGQGYDGNNWAKERLGMSNLGGRKRGQDLSDNNRIVSSRQNAITSVTVPGGQKEGLDFTHSIKLTFDYELRSYDGINARSAMLDLIGNILMVTYLQGTFFKGSYRATNMHASQLFTNLDIFKNKEATKSFGGLAGSLWTSAKQLGAGLGFTGENGNFLQAIKNIGSNLFELFANNMINKMGKPQIQAVTSMICPNPTGQWHLTIGNPRNPIMMIGNLVMKNAQIEQYGPLGLDDFPTGLKVTVELEPAKPRDSVAIEQMYMQGNDRIYTPMGDEIETMYKTASSINKGLSTPSGGNVTTGTSVNTGDYGLSDFVDDITGEFNNTVDVFTQIGQEIKATVVSDYNSIKSKITEVFGTDDIQGIIVAANEALVGADVSSKKSKK